MQTQSQPRERIYFSTFPDVVAEPDPSGIDVVSIHRPVFVAPKALRAWMQDVLRAVEAARCFVVLWSFDAELDDYSQVAAVSTEDITAARDYVPSGFARFAVPSEFGIESWKAGA